MGNCTQKLEILISHQLKFTVHSPLKFIWLNLDSFEQLNFFAENCFVLFIFPWMTLKCQKSCIKNFEASDLAKLDLQVQPFKAISSKQYLLFKKSLNIQRKHDFFAIFHFFLPFLYQFVVPCFFLTIFALLAWPVWLGQEKCDTGTLGEETTCKKTKRERSFLLFSNLPDISDHSKR